MSASKLSESFSDWFMRNATFPRSTVLDILEACKFAEAYAGEMALRVFEDTRERAAVLNCPLCKLVNDPEARFKVEPVKDGEHHINDEWGWYKPCASVAIRAMQPDLCPK